MAVAATESAARTGGRTPPAITSGSSTPPRRCSPRGLDATLDDIARHAGVNIATAYRHFANKHELAREFLRQCVDRAVAMIEETAAEPDPWAGLTLFLQRSLEMIASNQALVDVPTRAHGADHSLSC